MQNNKELNNDVLVSVVVITYNHAKYISKCLESILSQKTNFNYEIIVHNDCSTDSTKEILDRFQKEYPEVIKVVNQTSNQYSSGVNKMILNHVVPLIRGNYVCYIDGDDYWCSDLKLQTQFAFLEKHKDYSMCYTAAYCIDDKTNKKSGWYSFFCNKTIKTKNVFCKRFGSSIPSSTIMVKSEVYKDFPKWRLMFDVDDTPTFLLAAMNGRVYRFKQKTSVYRRNVDGSWTNSQSVASRLERSEKLEEIYKQMLLECDSDYHPLIVELSKMNYIFSAILRRDLNDFFKKEYRSARIKVDLKTRIYFWLEYHFPQVVDKLKR